MGFRGRIEYWFTAKLHIIIVITFCAIIGIWIIVSKLQPVLFPSCEKSIAEYEAAKRDNNPLSGLAYLNIPDKCNYR